MHQTNATPMDPTGLTHSPRKFWKFQRYLCLFIGILAFCTLNIAAQQPVITINERNITIEQAFRQIEKQTPYTIAYNRTKLDVDKRISLSLEKATVEKALTEILKNTGFGYKINGTHIVVVENKQPAEGKPKKISVSGYVRDANTGETLIGCYLVEPDGKTGVATNAFGYFNMEQEPGGCTIVAHYLGYADQAVDMHLVRDTVITIKLKPTQTKLAEVVVVGSKTGAEARLSKPQMSMMTLNSKEIAKMPALLGEADVMRAIQTLPGIQAANERSTGISVRGGSIDQNLFLLDDAPVFQISHGLGYFSVFNNDAVKDVRIYKGDIPANYGGRISSVVDIRLRDGNMQKYQVSGGIGIVSANLGVEGPIVKDRVSFIVSGKYAYPGLIYRLINKNIDMSFYDFNFKLNAVVNHKNRIYLSSYNGGDNSNIILLYRNNTMSLRWNHVYTPRLFSNISLVYSNYHSQTNDRSDSDNDESTYTWRSGMKLLTLKAEYNYFINNRNTLDFGASATYHYFTPGKLEGNRQMVDYLKETTPFSNRVTEEQAVLDYALYAANKQEITDRLSLRYGIRASLYQNLGGHWVYKLNDEHTVVDSFYMAKNKTYANYFSIEPRVSLNYRIAPHSAVKAAYTYTTQQSQLLMKTNGGGPMDVWFPSGNNIRPQTASQYSLGFVQYLFGDRLEASVEGYYKRMRHIIDYKDGASFLDKGAFISANQTSYNFEEQLRTGRGYAYGMEVTLKAGFRHVDGFASYAWARSKRKIEEINSGATYLSPFDKPHTLNISLNYDTGKRRSFSANFRWQSGQVTTVPIYVMEMYGKVLASYSDRNGHRLPSYQRLDLSMTVKGRKNPLRRWQGEWNFSVMNVYNHANLDYVKFVVPKEAPGTIQAKGVSMFGFLPSVAYRFRF